MGSKTRMNITGERGSPWKVPVLNGNLVVVHDHNGLTIKELQHRPTPYIAVKDICSSAPTFPHGHYEQVYVYWCCSTCIQGGSGLPKTKKACLDQNTLANYRPISNLTFLSNVLERVVAARLVAYLEENKLSEPNQSSYRKGHSTETALVRVQHDILNAIGGQQAVLLVLLDLSAACDTVLSKALHHLYRPLSLSSMSASSDKLSVIICPRYL